MNNGENVCLPSAGVVDVWEGIRPELRDFTNRKPFNTASMVPCQSSPQGQIYLCCGAILVSIVSLYPLNTRSNPTSHFFKKSLLNASALLRPLRFTYEHASLSDGRRHSLLVAAAVVQALRAEDDEEEALVNAGCTGLSPGAAVTIQAAGLAHNNSRLPGRMQRMEVCLWRQHQGQLVPRCSKQSIFCWLQTASAWDQP